MVITNGGCQVNKQDWFEHVHVHVTFMQVSGRCLAIGYQLYLYDTSTYESKTLATHEWLNLFPSERKLSAIVDLLWCYLPHIEDKVLFYSSFISGYVSYPSSISKAFSMPKLFAVHGKISFNKLIASINRFVITDID